MRISLKAVWNYRCPKCRHNESALFKKPFQMTSPLDMNRECRFCGQNFEPEPGYYYGAMFLSYIISSFLLLPIALILVFYFNWSDFQTMAFIILLGGLIFFRILRMSRSLWIHMMVRYKPEAISNRPRQQLNQ